MSFAMDSQQIENTKLVLRGLFYRHCGVMMAHDLHDAGFTDIQELVGLKLIARRPGRWDVGFQKGPDLDPVQFSP
ncbi:MAG: hypothetical protein ACK4UN_15545, partial [Limisphaerales bacterium]